MKFTAKAGQSVLFIITIIISTSSCSFKPSPKKIVVDFIDVKNSHNISATMEFISDDAVLEIPKLGVKMEGKEERRAIAEYDSALHTVLTPSNITVSGDTVFCSITEHNDWVEAAEIPDVYYPRVTFVVEDSRITYTRAEMADSSKENYERVLDQFVFWGNDNYPDKMKKMAPEGIFNYNAENGTMVVEMLREWKAQQEQVQKSPVTNIMPRRMDKGK